MKSASYDKKVLSIGTRGKALVVRVKAPNVIHGRDSFRSVQAITHWPLDLIRSTLANGNTHREYFLMLASELNDNGFFPGMSQADIANLILPLIAFHVPQPKEAPQEEVAKPKVTSRVPQAKKAQSPKTASPKSKSKVTFA